MNRETCLALFFAAICAPSGRPQQPVTITVQPAAAPVPALKYLLLPEAVDLKPGNAAVDYYRAFSPEMISTWRSDPLSRKAEKWRKMPLKDLPREEIKRTARWVLQELDAGARCAQCDWQMDAKVRAEGISLLVPDLQGFRALLDFLAARARGEIAEGNFTQSARTLQTGFAFSRHLNHYPTLISHLVAAADADAMLDQVETFIQAPGAPNLYWALTNLPEPLLDLGQALSMERMFADTVFPSWRSFSEAPLSPREAWRQSKQIIQYLGSFGFANEWTPEWQEKVLEPLMIAKCYPTAKRYLIEHGRKPEEVEAMAALQVVILFTVERFQVRRDEILKWLNLPYWQSRAGLAQADLDLQHAAERLDEGLPILDYVLPALSRITIRRAMIDRRIAALRVVEAIRLWAASHDGKLPSRLGEVTEVPVPIDPMTGKSFEYRVQGEGAVLSGPAPSESAGDRKNAICYELKLRSSN